MKRKYPWERWFSLSRFVLLRGVHYLCSQSTMAQTVRNNASTRGLRVRITDTSTEIIVEVMGNRNEVSHTDKAPVAGQHADALATDGALEKGTAESYQVQSHR